jgi:hypothetical protein
MFTQPLCASVTKTIIITPLTKENEVLPLSDPILYSISTSLTADECTRVFGFMKAHHYASVKKKTLTFRQLTDYSKRYRNSQPSSSMVTNSEECFELLKIWNEKLIGKLTKDAVDSNDIVHWVILKQSTAKLL